MFSTQALGCSVESGTCRRIIIVLKGELEHLTSGFISNEGNGGCSSTIFNGCIYYISNKQSNKLPYSTTDPILTCCVKPTDTINISLLSYTEPNMYRAWWRK